MCVFLNLSPADKKPCTLSAVSFISVVITKSFWFLLEKVPAKTLDPSPPENKTRAQRVSPADKRILTEICSVTLYHTALSHYGGSEQSNNPPNNFDRSEKSRRSKKLLSRFVNTITRRDVMFIFKTAAISDDKNRVGV